MCKWWVQFLGKALVKFSLNCWANKVAVYSLGSLVLCAAPVTQGLGWLRRDSLERGPQPARALLRWVNRKRWVGMFLQPPCLLVPQAPNLGCLSCSVWAFLSSPQTDGPLLCCSPAGTKGRVRDSPLGCAYCRSQNCGWRWQDQGTSPCVSVNRCGVLWRKCVGIAGVHLCVPGRLPRQDISDGRKVLSCPAGMLAVCS